MSKLYCSIYNGLGNQLFGFALGMFFAKNNNKRLVVDTTKLNFSDDTDYVKKNLNYENSYVVEGNKGYEDLYLMILCNHFILVNSTFSFWGAILSESRNKTI